VLPLKDLPFAAQDKRGRTVGEKVTGWGGKSLEELEGQPGGRTWVAGTEDHAEYILYYSI